MKKIPTDLEILTEIYNRYHDTFRSYAKDEPDRITRIRVPIDINEIAEVCGVEEDMIFGRLYYHFNKKYSYKNENGDTVTFFSSMKFEGLSVNFPLVASVLADLKEKEKTYKYAYLMAGVSMVFAFSALLVSLLF